METYSVFIDERYDVEKKQWNTSLFFMYGKHDLFSQIDFDTDWRFCEVTGKRKKSKLIGDCNTEFPIVYPLVLNDAKKINNMGVEISA